MMLDQWEVEMHARINWRRWRNMGTTVVRHANGSHTAYIENDHGLKTYIRHPSADAFDVSDIDNEYGIIERG